MMRSLLVAVSLLTLSPEVAFARKPAPAAPASVQETVVVHLSHGTNDLHAAMMALKLGTGIAGHGDRVVLFVDLEGVRIADARTQDDLSWGAGHATLGALYAAFIEAGGSVMVCPHCAAAAGLTAEHLRPGAHIATFDELSGLLAGAARILDY